MKRCMLVFALLLIVCLSAPGQEKTAAQVGKAVVAVPANVNFSEHIAPIVFNNCASCHRPGEAGPFPLLSYKDVRKRAKLIRDVTESRYMPPWHPAPGHGDFMHERRLSDEQIAMIKRWVETDMPEGDVAKMPKVPVFPEGWTLGKPDLIVTMDKAYAVPATGRDIYRNFVLPLNLKETKYVTAIELRPTARSVVHHVLFFLDTKGAARKKDGKDGKPGFNGASFIGNGGEGLGGWVPGIIPEHYPSGLGRPVPAGADLILQTHFHPSGKAESEKTSVGLYFAKETPKRTLVNFQAPPLFGSLAGISIPAGDKAWKLHGQFKAPVDMELISAQGHAHYICETVKVKATLPDGTTKSLLYIPHWDFNWQSEYFYKEPVRLPKGSVIHADLTYNNTAANPANPFNPPQQIRWGTSTTDEMGSVIFNAVPVRESEVAALRTGVYTQIVDLEGILGKDGILNRIKGLKKK